LTDATPPGAHRLAIRVDNTYRLDIGRLGHSITEETQTNWNGIAGRIALRATDPVWIRAAQVHPDLERKEVRARVAIGNRTGTPARVTIRARVAPADRLDGGTSGAVEIECGAGAEAEILLPAAGLPLWDEFAPSLSILAISIEAKAGGKTFRDERRVTFGMREFRAKGTQFSINGRTTFLRGTLECCIFPRTGYPATSVRDWTRILTTARSYGLNHMRFHSWCPPDAAFAAADALGMYLHVELPFWHVNAGQDPPRDAFLREELDRILDAYGNHPSFCLMCMGNELGGDFGFLEELVAHGRQKDPRHLYLCATARRTVPSDQCRVTHATEKGRVRGLRGPATDWDFRAAIAGTAIPIVSHEIGQWGIYPNFDEIPKYTGPLRPRNFEVFRESLDPHGMLDLAPAFVRASGALMLLLYKEEMEAALRTPGFGGFQLLDLHDFPGQGTALVGTLDAFWDSKGLISPEAFRRYCGPTVPLLRLAKRVFSTDETLTARAEIAHFGSAPLANATPEWSIADAGGRRIATGVLPEATIPNGALTPLGEIRWPLEACPGAAKLRVTVSIQGTEIANAWDVWVYPRGADPEPAGILVADQWDEAREALAAGRRVLFLAARRSLATSIPARFTSLFWSPLFFPNQVKTLGLLCDPAHPALARFPTASHTDWQWWDVLAGSKVMILEGLPPDVRPIVRVIDSFATNRPLGVLFEARVGKGRLVATSLDLERDLAERHAARRLRSSLLAYMASDAFRPEHALEAAVLDELFRPPVIEGLEASPPAGARAALDVRAAVHMPANLAKPWRADQDEVLARAEGFDYAIAGGSWLDATGTAWHDANLRVTVTCPKGFEGTLYAHFHDWNALGRVAEIAFDGKALGALGDYAGEGTWLAFPVTKAESSDGRLEIAARAASGPNAQITRIILLPKVVR
ncbi:MAG: hypothetical protein JXP34_12225, partial [Planctomycetes bacterium]|nr:hypothetical protein [Planctomycetota bacterium]